MREAWPVCGVQAALRQLTAPGAPFEMQEARLGGRLQRIYRAAAPTLVHILNESRRFGDRDLLVYEGERVGFEAHWRAAATLAGVLCETFGLEPGDRVAIAMRNLPEWSVAAWAALAAGGVAVPLNAWEPGPVLADLLQTAGARVLIADEERLERLRPHLAAVPQLTILSVRSTTSTLRLEDLIGSPESWANLPEPSLSAPQVGPDDNATLFFTSGTTGASKGALGTHRNIATNVVNVGLRAALAAIMRGDSIPVSGDGRRVQLLPLPFFHVTGFHSALVPAVANGATLILMRKWDPSRALELIDLEAINALTLVPSQALQLLEHPSLDPGRLRTLEAVGYGGAAAPPHLAALVRGRLPSTWAGQGYGATETSSLVATHSGEGMLRRPDSVGIAAPCCDLRVVGPDGEPAPAGAPGELWVRGPNVVSGYWRAPEATASVFVDGWYRTGDIARIDEEGYLYILDRTKDVLIRGGENIYCPEVEAALGIHPAVEEVAVMGVPDPILGEVVGAVCRLKEGARANPAEIAEAAAARLAPFKRPVVLLLRTDALPRNAASKVLKGELRAALIEDGVDLRG